MSYQDSMKLEWVWRVLDTEPSALWSLTVVQSLGADIQFYGQTHQ